MSDAFRFKSSILNIYRISPIIRTRLLLRKDEKKKNEWLHQHFYSEALLFYKNTHAIKYAEEKNVFSVVFDTFYPHIKTCGPPLSLSLSSLSLSFYLEQTKESRTWLLTAMYQRCLTHTTITSLRQMKITISRVHIYRMKLEWANESIALPVLDKKCAPFIFPNALTQKIAMEYSPKWKSTTFIEQNYLGIFQSIE